MSRPSPRLAVRAVIVEDERLLLVNAFAKPDIPLLCLPGGGVERGASLPDNLAREVYEETGLRIAVGAPCMINEFHDPNGTFHQVDVFFHASITKDSPRPDKWTDAENVVTRRLWLTQAELADVPHKPSSLSALAFGTGGGISYDALEPFWTP